MNDLSNVVFCCFDMFKYLSVRSAIDRPHASQHAARPLAYRPVSSSIHPPTHRHDAHLMRSAALQIIPPPPHPNLPIHVLPPAHHLAVLSCACLRMYVCVCPVSVFVRVCTRLYLHVYVYMCVWMCVCMCVCVCASVHVCT